MKVGILGTGNIGRTLARKLSAAGYEIEVANSRGPETIPAEVTEFGARAVTSAEAVADAHVVILSIPLCSIVAIAPLLQGLPADTVIIDTSNYYPQRDGTIDAIEAGQAESEWVSEQLGRPVAKAWNAIGADSFAKKGRPEGAHDRIAIPVAANNARDCNVAMALVHDTGLDAVKAGTLGSLGVSSQERPAIALISRTSKFLRHSPQQNVIACRRGVIWPFLPLPSGWATVRRIPTWTTTCA